MKIAVIGTGHIGGALTRLWTAHGHEVIRGVRSEQQIEPARAAFPASRAATIHAAEEAAEVVVLAVPWGAVASVLAQTGSLAGKLLIDTTNPLTPSLDALALPGGASAAEVIQQTKPEARVVKAFNSLGAAYLGNGRVGGDLADGFYCGDDPQAKSAAALLIGEAGLHPVDTGPLRSARSLEALAVLWIDLAVHQRRPGRFAFKLLTEPGA